jgi:hypothetical protein
MFEASPLAYAGGIGVIDMELLSVIRRWRYRDHYSIREISRRTDPSRHTGSCQTAPPHAKLQRKGQIDIEIVPHQHQRDLLSGN